MPERDPLGRIERSAKVFLSYSREDLDVARAVYDHLVAFRRNGGSVFFDEAWIEAGERWKRKLDEALDEADLYLLLISKDFLNSEYCINEECRVALRRHLDLGARLWPFLVRDCAWQRFPLKDGRGNEMSLGEIQLAGPMDAKNRPRALVKFAVEERDEPLKRLADRAFETLLGRPRPSGETGLPAGAAGAALAGRARPDAQSAEVLLALCDRSEQIAGMLECFRRIAAGGPGMRTLLVAGGCEHDALSYLRTRLLHRAAQRFQKETSLAPVRVIEGKDWSTLTARDPVDRVREGIARLCAQTERAAHQSLAEAMNELRDDIAHRIVVFNVTVEPGDVPDQARRLEKLRAALAALGPLRGHLAVVVLYTLCGPPRGWMHRLAALFGGRGDPRRAYEALVRGPSGDACPTADLGLVGKLRKTHVDEWRTDYGPQLRLTFGAALEPKARRVEREIARAEGIYYRAFVDCFKASE